MGGGKGCLQHSSELGVTVRDVGSFSRLVAQGADNVAQDEQAEVDVDPFLEPVARRLRGRVSF